MAASGGASPSVLGSTLQGVHRRLCEPGVLSNELRSTLGYSQATVLRAVRDLRDDDRAKFAAWADAELEAAVASACDGLSASQASARSLFPQLQAALLSVYKDAVPRFLQSVQRGKRAAEEQPVGRNTRAHVGPLDAAPAEGAVAAGSAFAAHLEAALASVDALPEPVRWALTTLHAVARDVAPNGPLPLPEPPDSAADVAAAVATLSNVCASRLRGEDFAVAAVECFTDAWVSRKPNVPRCANPSCKRCEADAALSLLAVVQHFDADASTPAAGSRYVGKTVAELAAQGLPMHTLSPSLLGRFFEMARCHRYLHLRTDRGRVSNEQEQRDRDGGDAALEPLSRGASVLRKGLMWEARLNEHIQQADEAGNKPLCPKELYGADIGAAPAQRMRFLDLTLAPYSACTCDFKRAGLGQRDESGRERQHRNCPFNAALLEASLDALYGACDGDEDEALVLYQAKFKVPDEAYTSSSGTIDKSQVSFSNFQPDYLVVTRVNGERTLVVVDAKSSGRVKQAHRVQVAFYCLMLSRFLRTEALRRDPRKPHALGVIARHGAVWRPPGPGAAADAPCSAPESFQVTDLVAELERLIYHKLAGSHNHRAVLSQTAYEKARDGRQRGEVCAGQSWTLQPSCAGCDFLQACRAEAASSTEPARRLRGVSSAAADAALSALGDIEDTSVGLLRGDVARLYNALDAERNPLLSKKLADLQFGSAGARAIGGALAVPYDAGGLTLDATPRFGAAADAAAEAAGVGSLCASPKLLAAATGRAIVHAGAISLSFPCPPDANKAPDWGIFVALSTEPITGELAGFCVQVMRLDSGTRGAADFAARPPVVAMLDRAAFDAEGEVAEKLARETLVTKLVRELALAFGALERQNVCVYVLEPWERTTLLAALASVAMQPSAAEAALGVTAQRVLLAVLDGRALESTNGSTAQSIEEALAADLPHLCTLQTEVGRLMELPAPGFATLEDAAAHVAPRGAGPYGTFGATRLALELLLGGDAAGDIAAAAAAAAAVGSTPAPGVDTEPFAVEALRCAARAAGPDSLYRDWSARFVGGVPRAEVLLARRCRLGALLLAGLRGALADAAAALQPPGAAYFAPNGAPTMSAQQDGAFSSALVRQSMLFKRVEQAGSAASMREERAAPLARRVAKGSAVVVTVLAMNTKVTGKTREGMDAEMSVECQPRTVAEAAQAEKLLTKSDYTALLLAPNSRAGQLSALRFPDVALAEEGIAAGFTWTKLGYKNTDAGMLLRNSLLLGFAAIADKTVRETLEAASEAAPPLNALPPPVRTKLRVPLRYRDELLTALSEADLQPGARLVVFQRFTDVTSREVASAARFAVDSADPADSDWLSKLMPGTELVLHPRCSASGKVAHVATLVKLPDGDMPLLDVMVTNPEAADATEPELKRVAVGDIYCKFSLFRTLLAEAGPDDAPPGVYPDGAADGPPSGAAACTTPAGRWTFPDHDLLPCTLDVATATHIALARPTASQAKAFRQAATHRLSTIWGPPGSGKTHWATGTLVTLLKLHWDAKIPFRAVITAQSWDAIDLLVNKVAARLKALKDAGEAWAGRVCVVKRVNSPDSVLNPKRTDPHGLPDGLWRPDLALCVVGATVWQAAKYFGPYKARGYNVKPFTPRERNGKPSPAPKLQLIMIDEASQLTAADAMLVADLVDPHRGRIIAMGDHLQLPPVLQGLYPVPTAASGAGAAPPRPWCSTLDALRAAQACEPAMTAQGAGLTRAAEHMAACTLLDNHRMCETLAQFCRAPDGLYPADYSPCDAPCGVAGTADCANTACDCRAKAPWRQTRGPGAVGVEGGAMRFDLTSPSAPTGWVAEVLAADAKLITVRVPAALPEALPERSEAFLAATLLRAAAAAWIFDDEGEEPTTPAKRLAVFMSRVLVAAPHHSQIEELRFALGASEPVQLRQLSINTVEKQQGQEANLVLILYGLTDAAQVAAEAGFLYSQARLNVALTRSKMKAVLFLARAVQAPTLDGGGPGADGVADGLALLQRVVRVCKTGGAYAHLPNMPQPQRGARFVHVLPPSDDAGDSQASSQGLMLVDSAPRRAGTEGDVVHAFASMSPPAP